MHGVTKPARPLVNVAASLLRSMSRWCGEWERTRERTTRCVYRQRYPGLHHGLSDWSAPLPVSP